MRYIVYEIRGESHVPIAEFNFEHLAKEEASRLNRCGDFTYYVGG